jgi:hypothetical protein
MESALPRPHADCRVQHEAHRLTQRNVRRTSLRTGGERVHRTGLEQRTGEIMTVEQEQAGFPAPTLSVVVASSGDRARLESCEALREASAAWLAEPIVTLRADAAVSEARRSRVRTTDNSYPAEVGT